jgi:WD repeat-containing protein 59
MSIKAHNAKIYGIDWSRRNEIITCSLDKTIKLWDILEQEKGTPEPKAIIHTTYPVWRARDLPFADGLLSIPQRGETALELWTARDGHNPLHVFEGHTDVVKQFVWRQGGKGPYRAWYRNMSLTRTFKG